MVRVADEYVLQIPREWVGIACGRDQCVKNTRPDEVRPQDALEAASNEGHRELGRGIGQKSPGDEKEDRHGKRAESLKQHQRFQLSAVHG
jgi:hypothetical protein